MKHELSIGVVSLLALGCVEDARQRTVEIERRDGGVAVDGGPPAADATTVDLSAPDAELPDAQLPDLGASDAAVAPCVLTAQVIDGAGTPPVDCQLAPADTPSCEVIADCLCGLLPAVDPAECHWALAEPRALENLSDWCNGIRSLDDLLRRESWLMQAGPAKFELSWTPACADYPASF